MGIVFTDWTYSNISELDYAVESAKYDSNVNTMALGELILNDIVMITARGIEGIEDMVTSAISFADMTGTGVVIADRAHPANSFSDTSMGESSFTDWTKL